jgi:hypothetical protein
MRFWVRGTYYPQCSLIQNNVLIKEDSIPILFDIEWNKFTTLQRNVSGGQNTSYSTLND